MLHVEGVDAYYGLSHVLQGVSLTVEAGEAVALLGRNGAGKTTFFNLLTGVLPASAGQILFKGEDITGRPAHAVSRLGIARSYQVTNIFGDLTVFENVRIAAQSRVTHYRFWGNADRLAAVNERAEEILGHLGLSAKRHARLDFSVGEADNQQASFHACLRSTMSKSSSGRGWRCEASSTGSRRCSAWLSSRGLRASM